VAPISTYWKDRDGGYGRIYEHLRDYKKRGSRNELRLDLAALIVRFLQTHKACLHENFGPWTSIVVPPSSSSLRRGTEHPLESRLRATSLRDLISDPCLAPDEVVPEREASDKRYKTTRSVEGERILIIDDVWVTGSTVMSAASRLVLDGATVVGAVVVGRQVDPTWSSDDRAYWEMVEARGFRFSDCCLAGSHQKGP
jgi:hypothetical protein